jgi:hypothetical protein
MRLKQYLNEEYLKMVKIRYLSSHDVTEIFKNPSIKELREVGPYDIRFIADNKKKILYVWDGDKALHYEISTHLPISLNDEYPDILTGTIENKGGNKFEIEYSDDFESDVPSQFIENIKTLKDTIKWMEKYKIDVDPFVKRMERIAKSYERRYNL